MVSEETTTTADGLRALADILDAHPHELRHADFRSYLVYCKDREEMTAIIRAVGGRWDKDQPDGSAPYFGATLKLAGGVSLRVYTNRENVCERVQVGTEKVLVPAEQEPELAPAAMVEVERPVYEWRCSDSLLGGHMVPVR